jgi:hypothetical protein
MKWKTETTTPKVGDIRKRRVFAWSKTKVGDYWVWLETYQITEEWYVHVPIDPWDGFRGSWWLEISREVLENT